MAEARGLLRQAGLPATVASVLYALALFGAGLHCGPTPPAGLLQEAARQPHAVGLLWLPLFVGLMALMWQAQRFQGRPLLGMGIVLLAFVLPLFASVVIMPGFCALPVSGTVLAFGYGGACLLVAGLILLLLPAPKPDDTP